MRSPRACALVLFLGLTACAFRASGLEVALTIDAAPSSPGAMLHIEHVELLACPDAPGSASWSPPALVSVARAHDQPGIGPLVLALPSGTFDATLAERPGMYCDVRVHFGNRTHAALAMLGADETSPFEREAVLRLVDAEGAPVALALIAAPTRARLRLSLGAFDDDEAPAAALSRILAGARAEVVDAGR
jgi:hypothetical protein